MKTKYLYIILASVILASCENQPWEFPDYEYSTVYFAYQTPVRTLVLGTDYTFDNTLDNQHRCKIMATLGGVYKNENDVIIDVEVDNSLCDNLEFTADSGKSVLPLPENYYSLDASMQIVIPSGELIGGIEVQLTDAFFADTLSAKTSYVIPLVMTNVQNADSILRGTPVVDSPNRLAGGDWSVALKDYILYAVKYINEYDANYLRRGIEVIDGGERTNIYHAEHVEQDQVSKASTISRNMVTIPLETINADSTKTAFELVLSFDDNNNCTITNPETTSYTVTGSGQYVPDAETWGGESRNALYLNYEMELGASTHAFTDTLVLRDRGVALETFAPTIIN